MRKKTIKKGKPVGKARVVRKQATISKKEFHAILDKASQPVKDEPKPEPEQP